MIELLHTDCMDFMKTVPDKFFELAIVDPPYGIGEEWKKRTKNRKHKFRESSYKNLPATSEYFNEIKRVAINWVIWGWNYYTEFLGSSNHLICWDKQSADNPVFCYSKFELAVTSKKIPANLISIAWDGYRMGNETGVNKIHPHQKPVSLYKWLLKNYAKEGDKIFDSHLGSGSIAIACHDMKFDLVGCEIDKDYYDAAVKRFENHKKQLTIF